MTARPRPHIAKREKLINDEHYAVLHRLALLRVATLEQLRRLCDPFVRNRLGKPTSRQGVHQRLEVLVNHGLLRAGLSRPEKGAYSSHYYQLTWAGAKQLGRGADNTLFRRPVYDVLQYLLFRNEAYATLKADGWYVAGPDYTPESDHSNYLGLYVQFAKRSFTRRLDELEARGRIDVPTLMMARQDAARVEQFAPKALSFDFFFKVDKDRNPSELHFLAIDDPRRSVKSLVKQLPADWPPDSRLLLRDHVSAFDTTRQLLLRTNRRLGFWERLLRARYAPSTNIHLGQQLYDDSITNLTNTERPSLYPTLWAVRLGLPRP